MARPSRDRFYDTRVPLAGVSRGEVATRFGDRGLLQFGEGFQRTAGDLAMLATAAAVIGLFVISPEMLESLGFFYQSAGGGALGKFHPSTYFAIAALALRCAATDRPLRTAWQLATSDTGVVILLLAVGATGFYAVVVSKTPFTGLVDTFVLAPICFLLLRNLDPTIRRWIALAVLAVLCVNACMAIAEFLGHFHFMQVSVPDGATSDPTRGDGTFDWRAQLALDWRATALLGHPLANGLIVGCLLVCLAAPGSRWLPAQYKLPLALLQGAAMFAFGARTSLVLMLVLSSILLVRQAVEQVASGRRLKPHPRTLAWTLVIVALVVAAIGVFFASGLADRTVDRFANDEGSAKSRITMLEMFTPLSWTDIVMGPDQEVIATLQRLNGLEFGIESSWVGLILAYGLLITSFIVVGLLAFCRSIVRSCGAGATAVLIVYFASVSGMASLSGKTTSFAVIVCLIMLFLPRESAPARAPPTFW